MNRIIGAVDIFFGGMFFIFFLAALASIPIALNEFDREPEDLYILIVLLSLSIVYSVTFFMVGIIIFRSKLFRWVSMRTIRLANIVLGIVIFVVAVFALAHDYTRLLEGSLIIPAAMLAVSYFRLRSIN